MMGPNPDLSNDSGRNENPRQHPDRPLGSVEPLVAAPPSDVEPSEVVVHRTSRMQG